jgi:serine/threonine protein kinase/WD40 repeat protein
MLEGALRLGSRPSAVTAEEPAATEDLADPEAGMRIGRYHLLQRIGEGGFGSVFMADQETPVCRRVALKIIKAGMDTRRVVARFEAERQALALMDHPNIAKVLDAGATDTGRPYFVMELVRGIKVTDYCDQHHLTTRQRLDLFLQICHAVQHAHQKGIIHRDLKPSNLLVTIIDGAPVPRVIDFGIAKATSGQRLTDKTLFTAFDQLIGTPAYMSPEQAEMSGVDIDTRTDIYSLGVVLYELLTGRTPFDGEELRRSGLDEIRRTIREKEPVRPSTKLSQTLAAGDVRLKSPSSEEPARNAEIGASRRLLRLKETIRLLRRDLDWVVMKCLEKDRNRRYETVNALAADVERHLKGEPVAARPPSATYKLQKLVRRNKLAFIAGAAVATALLAGAVASTWQAIRATRAQQAERRIAEVAQAARRQSEDDLWTSLLAEARALRFGKELGRKTRGLDAVAQAARIRTSPELVNEAIAQLALFDLKPTTNWGTPQGARGRLAFDHALERVVTHTEDGSVRLWNMRDGAKLKEWKVPRSRAGHRPTEFTPDGRYLVVRRDLVPTDVLLDSMQPAPLRDLQDARWLAFSPDSRRYASLERDGAEVVVREIASGRPILSLAPGSGRKFTDEGASHPSTNLLVIAEGAIASLWHWDTGDRIGTFDYRATIRALTLDGPWVAAGGSQKIRLWNRENRRMVDIMAHEGRISALMFLPRGELLMSHGGDGDTSLWHPAFGKLVLNTQSGMAQRVSPDGRKVAFISYGSHGQWDVAAPVGRRELPSPLGAEWCRFSPSGELLATWTHRSVALYDVASGLALPGPVLADANVDSVNLAEFLPDNRTLIVGGPHGLVSWICERVVDSNGFALRWGPARSITASEMGPFGAASPAALVANGTRVALPGRDLRSFVLLPLPMVGQASSLPPGIPAPNPITGGMPAEAGWKPAPLPKPPIRFTGRAAPRSFALSPDGRWLATGTFHGQGPCIWDAQTGQPVQDLETDNSHAWFSPDGRVLLIGGTEWYRFLQTGTWRELHRIPTGSGQGVPNQATWSEDGRLLAIAHRRRQVKLLDGRTWQPLVDLTSPAESSLTDLQFSPDGRRLAICRPTGPVELWDLAELTTALQGLGLKVDLRLAPR